MDHSLLPTPHHSGVTGIDMKCGHTSKANRPNNALLFHCECCGYELRSDLLGSRNIALRTSIVRQEWMSTGTLSMCLQGVG
jgi:hypothetical protein